MLPDPQWVARGGEENGRLWMEDGLPCWPLMEDGSNKGNEVWWYLGAGGEGHFPPWLWLPLLMWDIVAGDDGKREGGMAVFLLGESAIHHECLCQPIHGQSRWCESGCWWLVVPQDCSYLTSRMRPRWDLVTDIFNGGANGCTIIGLTYYGGWFGTLFWVILIGMFSVMHASIPNNGMG